jgi:large subunit ribosomal protein L4
MLRGPVKKDRPTPVERSVERRDATGAVLSTVALEPSIFGIEPNLDVLHQVVTAQLAAKRAGTQSTRTRAEVRGGGHKPYRQKGTGHARQGSTRAPHFVGGGVAFAPKPRSYAQRTPKKMVRLALRSALSDRASEQRVALLDRFGWEAPKTRDAVALLDALGLDGRVLVVLSRTDGVAARAMRNLERASTVDAGELNAHDVLAHDWVLFTDETLPVAERGSDEDDTAPEQPAKAAPKPRARTTAKPKAESAPDADAAAVPADETEGA